MSKQMSTHLSDSVRERLLNLSRKRQDDFNLLLVRYAIERFLYRLSQSPFAHQFVLKGATLFTVWSGELHRPTRDLDLLGFGDSSSEVLQSLFSTICKLPVEDDGLVFDSSTIKVAEIRETQEYGGKRVTLSVYLGSAVIPLKVDVGFGDVITPGSVLSIYPTLLPNPEPHLRTYPKESVVAEKLQAMVVLGLANSRMKDFYDLWILSRHFSFQGPSLKQAIEATFTRRQTELSQSVPTALTAVFAKDSEKIKQWRAFLDRNALDVCDATS